MNCSGSNVYVKYCYFKSNINSPNPLYLFDLETSGRNYTIRRKPYQDACSSEFCCGNTDLDFFSTPSSFSIQAGSSVLEFNQNFNAFRKVNSSPVQCGGLLLIQLRIGKVQNCYAHFSLCLLHSVHEKILYCGYSKFDSLLNTNTTIYPISPTVCKNISFFSCSNKSFLYNRLIPTIKYAVTAMYSIVAAKILGMLFAV